MNQTPLNPDAPDSQVSVDQRVEVIETSARDYPSHGAVTISLHHSERQSTTIQIAERTAESLRDQLNDHLAAALPEVTSVEELAKAWHAGYCKGEQTAFRERPVNPDTINPYKNGERP